MCWERVPRLWMLFNQLNGFERFNEKCFTQTRRLLCIPCDRLVQLGLRRRQQADGHAVFGLTWYLAITSDKATALISPRR